MSASPSSTVDQAAPSAVSHTTDDAHHPDGNALIAERRAKLAAVRARGVAFPNDFTRTHFAAELHARYGGETREALEATPHTVRVAGRLMLKRVMGKASFGTLQDGGTVCDMASVGTENTAAGAAAIHKVADAQAVEESGKGATHAAEAAEGRCGNQNTRIQLYLNAAALEEQYEQFRHWDLGDILGAEGTLMKTRTGELSVQVSHIRLLVKALHPLPEKFQGLVDQEQKYRQRYLDLLSNPASRATFLARSRIVQTLREGMVQEGYLEVETPMMHPIPGGAAARPFSTHHNALDRTLYLRIAPELYLKRLLVGGLERVFEINRNFRNEGLSTRHNPEFTMMEFYEAHCDYRRMMSLTETLLRTCACAVYGMARVPYQGEVLDFAQPFARFTVSEAILHHNPVYRPEQLQHTDWLCTEIARLGGKLPVTANTPQEGMFSPEGTRIPTLQFALFEASTEQKLWNPTYIVDYPVAISPLARASDAHPEIAERFELFVAGRELANGFSELNDPEEQARRFAQQAAQKEAGDLEAMHYDSDYIEAMEYGMPPAGGCGIGIDRLTMLLTDTTTIRDVVLFPQLRS